MDHSSSDLAENPVPTSDDLVNFSTESEPELTVLESWKPKIWGYIHYWFFDHALDELQ